jgi:hypothetical protein
MKNMVLVFLLQFSFYGISQQPPIEYFEVLFQHQKFEGKKILDSFLKKHEKKKDAYKNAPCQFNLRCTFYLNEKGYIDSISAFKYGQYVSEPKVTFFDEIESEIKTQSKNYRFNNQVVYENDTTNMESFSLFIDYECERGWIINEYPYEYKRLKKFYKNISLNYRKE